MKMKNEVWQTIEGYENYQVSNLGRVKSLNYNRTGKEQILKPVKRKNKYLSVNLCKNGKIKNLLVHRLVAQAFLPNPKNMPDINHKDENKQMNIVSNLEWCTRKQNINYGTHNERVAKTLSIPIVQLTKNGEYIATYQGAMQVEKDLGFNNSNISSCCNGKRKTANGYKWQYLSDYQKAI